MRWWREQSEDTRRTVRGLVRDGRLDFVNGGWVQNDEAASHYVGMIDQTTRGHRWTAAHAVFLLLHTVVCSTGCMG